MIKETTVNLPSMKLRLSSSSSSFELPLLLLFLISSLGMNSNRHMMAINFTIILKMTSLRRILAKVKAFNLSANGHEKSTDGKVSCVSVVACPFP